MSTEPTGAGSNWIAKNHLNLKISRKDFCRKPDCIIDLNMDRNLCFFCKWAKKLDMYKMLQEEDCERNGECQE